jgi:hypothetical protein
LGTLAGLLWRGAADYSAGQLWQQPVYLFSILTSGLVCPGPALIPFSGLEPVAVTTAIPPFSLDNALPDIILMRASPHGKKYHCRLKAADSSDNQGNWWCANKVATALRV